MLFLCIDANLTNGHSLQLNKLLFHVLSSQSSTLSVKQNKYVQATQLSNKDEGLQFSKLNTTKAEISVH